MPNISRKGVGPRLTIAGRIDPRDMATCLVYFIEQGFEIENKSDLVFHTFALAATYARSTNPDLDKPGYYEDYYTLMEQMGISFDSERDRQDKIKALVRDSLEEFDPEDQEAILRLMMDLRLKAKKKGEARQQDDAEDVDLSADDILSSL